VQDDWKVNKKANAQLRLCATICLSPKTEAQSPGFPILCLTCPNPSAGGVLGAVAVLQGREPAGLGSLVFLDTRKDAWGAEGRLGVFGHTDPW